MAFDATPTALWSGYSFDGTDLSIPLAALTGLTSAEANATTGDWREIMLAIISTAHTYYTALAAADKPQAFESGTPIYQTQTTGDLAPSVKVTYKMDFYVNLDVTDVADEPA
jgi:hypothetical protein